MPTGVREGGRERERERGRRHGNLHPTVRTQAFSGECRKFAGCDCRSSVTEGFLKIFLPGKEIVCVCEREREGRGGSNWRERERDQTISCHLGARERE